MILAIIALICLAVGGLVGYGSGYLDGRVNGETDVEAEFRAKEASLRPSKMSTSDMAKITFGVHG